MNKTGLLALFQNDGAEQLIWFLLGVFVGANLGMLCMAMLYFAGGDEPEVPNQDHSPWGKSLH